MPLSVFNDPRQRRLHADSLLFEQRMEAFSIMFSHAFVATVRVLYRLQAPRRALLEASAGVAIVLLVEDAFEVAAVAWMVYSHNLCLLQRLNDQMYRRRSSVFYAQLVFLLLYWATVIGIPTVHQILAVTEESKARFCKCGIAGC